jgi:hypothetical protein
MTSSISIAIAIVAAATGVGGGYYAGRSSVAVATCSVASSPTDEGKQSLTHVPLPMTGSKNF